MENEKEQVSLRTLDQGGAIAAFDHELQKALENAGSLLIDTQAAIAGSVAEAFWGGVGARIEEEVRRVLDEPMLKVVDAIMNR